MTTIRYKLTIEYNGAPYSGWQRQPDAPSVQQAIEEAIHGFSGQDVKLTVAGRTDAGVHARGQVAHVDLAEFTKPMQPFEVSKAINAHLRPQPVSIVNCEIVSDEFHARYDAQSKLYRYRIVNRYGLLALDQGFVWQCKRALDVTAMQEAAKMLLGKHDFTTFRDSECQAKNPVRTLDSIDITARAYDDHGAQEIIFEVQGQSFLHHMVRNIVGTLSLVGEGKWSADDVRAALEARDRTAGGPTAPSEGLCLVRIDYP